MREPTPVEGDLEEWKTAGVAAGLGCSIVVSIILAIVGGILVDRWLDTEPVFTLIGVALGLVVAGYQLYELAQMSKPDHRPGPLTRGVSKVVPKKKKEPEVE